MIAFNCGENLHFCLGGIGRERKGERERLEEGCKETESKENGESETNEIKKQQGQVGRRRRSRGGGGAK